MSGTPWHCRQIATSSPAPIVVCEREYLQDEIERLRAALVGANERLFDALAWTDSGGNCASHVHEARNVIRRALEADQ